MTLLGPLTVSEAKTAMFEQDASWVGALRKNAAQRFWQVPWN